MKTKIFYQIREYKTPNSYSTPMGTKLRPRWRAIKLITRLTIAGHRDIVMVPFSVNCKA
jgi:hypothetical protein